ncbi:IS30 family transposase [Agromyces larvae]|uniref:IS30 family transposase n=1 Tax=Agromyces larvae TaxID=2929802 RepID=A0ABY4BYL2_9MICO|nr:IS30 family transposase [Agromyces larvae]UOE44307.1 IS30 family transposase [Agromyces larvae]
MELRERGWSIAAAAREVGVSRTAGHNWSRGYKTYRGGVVVGFVAPLERLAVREISERFLSEDERIQIGDSLRAGKSMRTVARELGRSPSTIAREVARNSTGRDRYRPFEAHRHAVARRGRNHVPRIDSEDRLFAEVDELLQQRWSPEQISLHLRAKYPTDATMHLSTESIYQAVYRPGSPLSRPTRLAPHKPSPLRTGRQHRRAQQGTDRRRPRFEQPMLTIHDRPFDPADRSELGHWEGDLIIGKEQGSAIGTLVERQTRTSRLLHLPLRDADALHDALVARMSDLPAELLKSITWDQGTEMARHLRVKESLGVPVYFCDSHSPWQRGSNENMNGLLRDYFPKGTDLSIYSAGHLRAVEDELNARPRKVLQGRSPAAVLPTLIASPHVPGVATMT